MINTTAPDGYTVDGTGAWIVNDLVQTQPHTNFVASITMNQELMGLFRTNDGISNFSVSLGTMTGVSANTDIYTVNYNNTILKVMMHREINQITGYLGEAKVLLNNIPTQRIELNAFCDNTGFKNANSGRRYVASILLTQGEDGNWYIYSNLIKASHVKGENKL